MTMINEASPTMTLAIASTTGFLNTTPEIDNEPSYTFSILRLVLAIPIVVGNSLTIAAFIKVPSLRSPSTVLLASLAIADVVVGIMLIYYAIPSFYPAMKYIKATCYVRHFLVLVAPSGSVVNFIALTGERLIAAVLPFKYKTLVTYKRAVLAAILTWIYTIFVIGISFIQSRWTSAECDIMENIPRWLHYTLLGHFVAFCLFTVIVYSVIGILVTHSKISQSTKSNCRKNGNQRKTTLTILVVVLAFVTCWLPFFVTQVVEMARYNYTDVIKVTFLIGVLNSLMNPIIYCWMSKRFRTAFLAMISCKFTSNPTFTQSTSLGNMKLNTCMYKHRDNYSL